MAKRASSKAKQGGDVPPVVTPAPDAYTVDPELDGKRRAAADQEFDDDGRPTWEVDQTTGELAQDVEGYLIAIDYSAGPKGPEVDDSTLRGEAPQTLETNPGDAVLKLKEDTPAKERANKFIALEGVYYEHEDAKNRPRRILWAGVQNIEHVGEDADGVWTYRPMP